MNLHIHTSRAGNQEFVFARFGHEAVIWLENEIFSFVYSVFITLSILCSLKLDKELEFPAIPIPSFRMIH